MYRSALTIAGAAGAAAALATGIALALTSGGGARPGAAALADRVPAAPPQTLRVVSVSPRDGSAGVNGTAPLTVTFSAPLAAASPMPRLSPAIPGTWRGAGDAAVFTPAAGFVAGTRVRVTVPGGDTGARSAAGTVLPAATSSAFTTGRYSLLRLQQILAQLGYLPLSWAPVLGATITPGDAAAQLAAAYTPPQGAFSWRWPGYPRSMYSLWRRGAANVLDSGAITAFEADHGLRPDGVAGPAVWAALLRAAAAGTGDRHAYSYAIASEAAPETLTIWRDGHEVFSSLDNTGIYDSPTPVGTFPVYEKLPFQIMRGTNPNGSYYADPVQWVSYFEGGAAVHYFPRGSYGWRQSLGCVELPYGPAEEAYRYLPYGTLVHVIP